MRDPREELGDKIGIYAYLHIPVPFGQLVDLHLEQMKQFPDRDLVPKTGKKVKPRFRS
jgi:hypothetical protein